jgi:putative ABC transport system permease protein
MRTYRLLLLLYPRAFRRRYADRMLAAFADERLERRHRGVFGRFRFWAHIARDLLTTAPRLRLRAAMPSARSVPRLPSQEGRSHMDTMLQDVRYALRQFVRRPGVAAVAVLSLAIGIGGNALIYGLVDGYVLRPFPYPDPDRLVGIGVNFPKMSSDITYVEALSPAEYADIRASRTFAQTAAFDLGNRNISGGDVPERVFTALLLDDLFPVIGMRPALGRGFTAAELAPKGPPVAIISHRLWQTRFGGDPMILTRPVRVNGEAVSIVGVMPRGLVLLGADLWVPWGGEPSAVPRNVRLFTILARLAPGATLQQADAELATVARQTEQAAAAAFREYEGWRLTATPWAEALMREVRPAAFLLLGTVAFVLLIACANLANLMLARSTSRRRELAVRLALGAGGGRLVRQLVTESVLVAIAGGAAGLLLAQAGFRAAAGLIPSQLQTMDLQAGVSPRVLLWTFVLSLLAGLVVAVLPAVYATRTDPHDSLKADGRSGGAAAGSRVRSALVVAEIAIAVVLLIGAGLLMRSFAKIHAVDPGFQADGVLTMRLTLPREKYQGERVNGFFDRLEERIGAIPGVRSVAAASQFPPMGAFDTQFTLERDAAAGSVTSAQITVATPRFFQTLGIPLRGGRTFADSDRLDAPRVAVVNQAFADRYLGGGNPVEQRIRIGDPGRPRPLVTIVGVAADTRNMGRTSPVRPEIYIPVRQQTVWNQLFFLVSSDTDSARLLPAVREAVRSIDPEQPIYAVRTLEDVVAESAFQQRAAAVLTSIFGAVALVLAAVGIFGVMSFSVSARTQEMGVRLAIGAQPRDVVWLVLRQVLRLTGVGLAIGVAVLLAAGRMMTGLLFGVAPTDPLTIAAVSLVLAVAALAAAWVPAWRAGKVDPIQALRYE